MPLGQMLSVHIQLVKAQSAKSNCGGLDLVHAKYTAKAESGYKMIKCCIVLADGDECGEKFHVDFSFTPIADWLA